ncbi:conserved hypothetical protein [Methanocaldococcus infernus ME]|uniref:Dehydrogenase (Flavoprotein)-like protein n=1 Tax=Methanocaldococcus infernus (strain DSM 11812 / JCM 15783 / ME) TaxID=573063 RepID=D5VRG5_METIM|nr:hypothetical protein [Methanocaldococcus infernus]ADG13168.1 conserved hypothetical protein [Methanocaldococcus infernus ME]
MKICIAGAGLAGSLLYYFLKNFGFNVDVYDPGIIRGCRSLNFVFQNKEERSLFKKVCKYLNVYINDYIVKEADLIINDKKVNKCYIINKTKFVENVLPRTLIIHREYKPMSSVMRAKVDELGNLIKEYSSEDHGKDYKLIVDASGVSKVMQEKKFNDDIKTCQFIIRSFKKIDDYIIENISLAKGKPLLQYFWITPMVEDGTYHIGCSSYNMSYIEMKSKVLEYIKEVFGSGYDIVCNCNNVINGSLMRESRLGGIYKGRAIASIGEAGGLISLLGFGNVYAFLSPFLLAKCINKYGIEDGIIRYKNLVSKTFSYLDERKIALKRCNILKVPKILKESLSISMSDCLELMMKSYLY